MKTTSLAGLFVTAALVTAACGSSPASSTGSPGTGAVLKSTQPGSIGNTWLIWDKTACKFKSATTHPATWTANLRKPTKPMRVGYGEQGEYTQFLVDMKSNMQDDASKVGIDLTVVNDNYPSTTDAVTLAQSLALRKPDAMISYNAIPSIMSAVVAPFKTNCVPFLQVSLAADGYPVFGASNETAGVTAGTWLADYAKKQNWAADSIVALGADNPTIGAAFALRVTKCQDTIVSKLPGAKKLSFNAGTALATAQTGMTDWLTAHPGEHHVMGCTIADTYAEGMANATKAANRTNDVVVVGMAGAADAIAAIKSGGSLQATVDFGFKRYGDYLIPLTEDIVEGKPVPAALYPKLAIIDKTND